MIEGLASARGSGLFAARAYEPGEAVARFPAVFVDVPDVHTVQIDDGRHLDTTGHPTRLLNHACDPSCVVDADGYGVIAVRSLAPGEELTFDYLTTEWELSAPFLCTCGGVGCVGLVRGYRFATPAQRAARAGRVSPYLARKRAFAGA